MLSSNPPTANSTLRRFQRTAPVLLAFVLLVAGARLASGQAHAPVPFLASSVSDPTQQPDYAGIGAIISGLALLTTAAGNLLVALIDRIRPMAPMPSNRDRLAETYRRRVGECGPPCPKCEQDRAITQCPPRSNDTGQPAQQRQPPTADSDTAAAKTPSTPQAGGAVSEPPT